MGEHSHRINYYLCCKKNLFFIKYHWRIKYVFRIRIDLKTDPDPAFEVYTDPDSDPGFFLTKMKENFFENFISIFQSLIA